MLKRPCTPREAIAIERFPATAGGHRFIVLACVLALVALGFLL